MKTKKQKIEIELEIEDGYEFDKYEPLICQTLFGDIAFTGIAKLKPIDPPLELETRTFVEGDKINSSLIFVAFENDFCISENLAIKEADARDLAAIALFYAEKGKLPDRVMVKGGK